MAAMVEIPPELFRAGALPDVIKHLLLQPAPGKDKVRALRRWAKWVGFSVTPLLAKLIDKSGVEAAPIYKLPGE